MNNTIRCTNETILMHSQVPSVIDENLDELIRHRSIRAVAVEYICGAKQLSWTRTGREPSHTYSSDRDDTTTTPWLDPLSLNTRYVSTSNMIRGFVARVVRHGAAGNVGIGTGA